MSSGCSLMGYGMRHSLSGVRFIYGVVPYGEKVNNINNINTA